jgi:hypothetical protein
MRQSANELGLAFVDCIVALIIARASLLADWLVGLIIARPSSLVDCLVELIIARPSSLVDWNPPKSGFTMTVSKYNIKWS